MGAEQWREETSQAHSPRGRSPVTCVLAGDNTAQARVLTGADTVLQEHAPLPEAHCGCPRRGQADGNSACTRLPPRLTVNTHSL